MIELRIAARADALEAARAELMGRLQPLGLSARACHRIELVLEETLMNLAWHAWDDGGEHEFTLAVDVADEALTLHFEDDGLPFDPTAQPDPKTPGALRDAVPGGLGIALVRRNARGVRYERRDGRNRLTVEVARG